MSISNNVSGALFPKEASNKSSVNFGVSNNDFSKIFDLVNKAVDQVEGGSGDLSRTAKDHLKTDVKKDIGQGSYLF